MTHTLMTTWLADGDTDSTDYPSLHRALQAAADRASDLGYAAELAGSPHRPVGLFMADIPVAVFTVTRRRSTHAEILAERAADADAARAAYWAAMDQPGRLSVEPSDNTKAAWLAVVDTLFERQN